MAHIRDNSSINKSMYELIFVITQSFLVPSCLDYTSSESTTFRDEVAPRREFILQNSVAIVELRAIVVAWFLNE